MVACGAIFRRLSSQNFSQKVYFFISDKEPLLSDYSFLPSNTAFCTIDIHANFLYVKMLC